MLCQLIKLCMVLLNAFISAHKSWSGNEMVVKEIWHLSFQLEDKHCLLHLSQLTISWCQLGWSDKKLFLRRIFCFVTSSWKCSSISQAGIPSGLSQWMSLRYCKIPNGNFYVNYFVFHLQSYNSSLFVILIKLSQFNEL